MKKKIIITISIIFGIILILETIFLIPRVGKYFSGIPSSYSNHISSLGGYSFSYPNNWMIRDTPSGNYGDPTIVTTMINIFGSPKITVSRKEFLSKDIYMVSKWGEEKLTTNGIIERIDYQSFQSFGNPIMSFEYFLTKNMVFGHLQYHCKDYYLLNNYSGYIFSFCSFNNQWGAVKDTFNKIVASISFQ